MWDLVQLNPISTLSQPYLNPIYTKTKNRKNTD